MASIFKRRKGKNEPYSIQYTDHLGKRKTVKGFTDKGLTEQLAGKLETEARLRTTGLIDAEQERLAEHKLAVLEPILAKFESSLGNNSAKHVELTMYRLRRIVAGCGFSKLADITREPVEQCLRELRETDGIGHRTFNHYVQAIDSFCNWCVERRRLLSNPLKGLQRLNPEVDVRHPRRALSPEEVSKLIAATRSSGKKAQNLAPEMRCRIYLFSCLTGLRKAEMASLTAASFRLDTAPPTVTVAAACSKHRRKDVLPLHPKLVIELRRWLRGLGPDEKLFPLLGRKKLSEMIQKDLQRAGIPYRTADGIADFHAAGRHTYITQLLRSGASLPEAKELARHSDVKMTMRYTHIGIGDQARAVANLPMPKTGRTKEQREVPTGALQMRCISGGAGGHSVSPNDNDVLDVKKNNPCRGRVLGNVRQSLSPIFKAEGTGVEPATGFPARHFQCRR